VQRIGFRSGRGFRSTQPNGPLNHLERPFLTTPAMSTTPMMAPWMRSSRPGFLTPRGSSFRGSRPIPAWIAMVPVA
jgi:hypothetical protein